MPATAQASDLMAKLRRGEPGAAEQLVDLFYPELRRLAAAKMRREREPHTWQPTALVNEFYLELRKIRQLREAAQDDPENEQKAFLSLAAFLMQRLLIHHARPLARQSERVDADCLTELGSGDEWLRQVEDALSGLEHIDPRLRQVVEMKVFGGLSGEEIAQHLGCSLRSVNRHWSFARDWLATNFAGLSPPA